MVFVSTTRIGLIEKAIDIYSRRGAENAEVTCIYCRVQYLLFIFLCVLSASARKKECKIFSPGCFIGLAVYYLMRSVIVLLIAAYSMKGSS